MSKLGKRLIGGLNEAIAIAGKNPAALQTLTIEVADVVEIRKSLKLTRDEFDRALPALGGDRQGLGAWPAQPDASANSYLLMTRHAPEVVEKVLAGAYGETS